MRIWSIKCCIAFAALFEFAVAQQSNLVKSGDFSDSAKSWTFNQGSSQATGAVKSGHYEISITKKGSEEYSPQLLQSEISLSKNEAYTLSFDAWASDTGFIKAFLGNNSNYTSYSDSSAGKVKIFPDKKTFTISFIMTQGSDSHSRLQFNCGISPLSKIFIDNVSLVKRTEPLISVLTPVAGEKWGTGIEKKITWMNSGTLTKVNISYSVDSAAPKVIAQKVQNVNEYWWKVPQDAISSHCKIIVSDTTGTITAESAVFTIAEATVPKPGEMVINGDFSDSSNWILENNSSSSKVSGKIIGGEYRVKIDTISPNPWQVKLYQKNIALEKGKMYKFSFDAYATSARAIFANIGLADGPYTSFTGGDTVPLQITTQKKNYTVTFMMNGDNTSNARVEFNLANDSPAVFIDNVSLLSIDTPPIYVLEPSEGTVWKAGVKYLIKWVTLALDSIDMVKIDYSTDNGTNWIVVKDSLENMGEFSWSVPDTILEKCLIRVSTLDGAIKNISSPFQINKTGVPIRTGELVVNGDFKNGTTGWNPLSFKNGGQATSEVKNGCLVISITNPGISDTDITLSQGGIPLLSGKEYYFQFDAFAPGDRKLSFDIVANDSIHTKIFDSTITLPSSMQSIGFHLTPNLNIEDGILEFHVGGSHAGVYIDNIKLQDAAKTVTSRVQKIKIDMLAFTDYGRAILFKVGMQGTLGIFSLNGKLVKRFTVNPGTVMWDKRDAGGAMLSRGSYIAVMKSSTLMAAKRFLLK